jgi:hypothetical protein
MTPERLSELAESARASRSLTVPGATCTVRIIGSDLLALVQLAQARQALLALPGFAVVLAALQSELADWRYYEKTRQERYPGEARARSNAYELLLRFLGQEGMGSRDEQPRRT